jgi:hypothetical protein
LPSKLGAKKLKPRVGVLLNMVPSVVSAYILRWLKKALLEWALRKASGGHHYLKNVQIRGPVNHSVNGKSLGSKGRH